MTTTTATPVRRRPWGTIILATVLVAGVIVLTLFVGRPMWRSAGYEAGVQAAQAALLEGDLSVLDLSPEAAVAFCDVAAEVKADGFTPARCNALIAEMIREAGSKGGQPAAEDGGK